ncbi:helix-turn-helix domain-containing protein [Kitasatospora sp. NPDC093550]|uniref:helix-turn-helix domain-containing protein n=1 Tax=Kitasatospora sp. NPDC093550 TaxID=3364089 RepID=UPI003806AB6A
MIRNERQLGVAKKKITELREAAESASSDERAVWMTLASKLAYEIDEYESIKRGETVTFEIRGLDDVPDALIKARISKRLNQAELAEILGVTEQMVQKDESGGYENARFSRMADVADALGYELVGRLQPAGKPHVTLLSASPSTPVVRPSTVILSTPTPSVVQTAVGQAAITVVTSIGSAVT